MIGFVLFLLTAYAKSSTKGADREAEKAIKQISAVFETAAKDLIRRFEGGDPPGEEELRSALMEKMQPFLERIKAGAERSAASAKGAMAKHLQKNLGIEANENGLPSSRSAWLRATAWVKDNLPFLAAYVAKEVALIFALASLKGWGKKEVQAKLKEPFAVTEERAKTLAITSLAAAQNEAQEGAAALLPPGKRLYLFLGPEDRITRPFCDVCNGYAFTAAQRSGLDNGQGLSVKRFCGGYNCRHTWVVITRAYAEERGIPLATDSVIDRANIAARQRR